VDFKHDVVDSAEDLEGFMEVTRVEVDFFVPGFCALGVGAATFQQKP
jgi:hypothetical protein